MRYQSRLWRHLKLQLESKTLDLVELRQNTFAPGLPTGAPAPERGGKVVNIMEALKRSMERIPAKKKPASTAAAKKKKMLS